MKSKGFTLLLSVLIVSIMLAISLGVSDIISSEIFLSGAGRESQLAFYAADAGINCAAYWDTDIAAGSPFSTTTPGTTNITCTGATKQVGGYPSCVANLDGSGASSACTASGEKKAGKSVFYLGFSNGSCAKVTVTKRQYYQPSNYDNTVVGAAPPSDAVIETHILSDGFNKGSVATQCSSNSARIFQRSIETTVYE
ncbi:hypothetical protein A3B18_00525 [Candidatus Giovannonibacteria bacterium RIFCSPLOWO2_01_FULL_46_13]|uniref:Type 4 fimbrial biogenesis protein PilX N-terminal domain-containing protein n=1 Tax=Candidatus Giovannonibacteria bacterium RIFCSPLOWO2_01_FULL_46_13 TaxID=1798352 RepID=A0A1F5X5I9_9BACT|nr:MAG: hypothetical protein A3B18_00525 [Candidatus Giovannonibacteria bacterium RIFCSPLOWO2_01_FULL_46_13]